MKQLSKANWIRLACFSAGGTLLFYLVPLILMQLPDPAKGNAMVILVMFVNQVFMGVVGCIRTTLANGASIFRWC